MRMLLLFLLITICDVAAGDDDMRSRFLKEFDSSHDLSVVAFAMRSAPLTSLGRPKIEIAAGLLDGDTERRGFVSIGPVWQHSSFERFGVLIKELSFSPTVLTAGKFENRDLGGILHFTSALGIGWKPKPQSRLYVGVRVQHISNGSIQRHNPGMDAVGIELLWSSE